MARFLVLVGAICVVAGVCAFAYADREARLYWYEPVVVPLSLASGATAHKSFTVTSSADYDVELAFARNIPFERLDTLVNGKESPLRVRWQLRRGSEVIAGGEPGERYGSSGGIDVSRILGRAGLETGTLYDLRVHVEAAPPELTACAPRLKVVRWFVPFKHHYVKAQMAAYGGILAGLLSVASCFGAWLARRAARASAQEATHLA